MVNLLGTGADRAGPARRASTGALADPDVHVHLYGKRRVFERRKMGHVTVVGDGRRRGAASGRAAARAALRLGGLSVRRRRRRVVGIVGGSRSDFPCLEKASMTLERAGHPVRAAGRVGPPHARPPVPLRRDGRATAASG